MEKPFTLLAFILLAAFAAAKLALKEAPNKVVTVFDMGMGGFSLVLMLALKEKLPSYYFPLYVRGCAIGAVFEFWFDVLGNDFCTILIPELRTPGVRAISHALTDGLLFVLGLGLVEEWLPAPHYTKYSLMEFGVMFLWGNLQEIIVDLVGNGWIWQYHETKYNPVMFSWNGQIYTFLPQLVWMITPLIFYVLTLVNVPSEHAIGELSKNTRLETPLLL